MDRLMYLFAAAVLLATALAAVAIWAPRWVAVKIGALVCAALLMPVAYAAFVELMGRPKPERLEWFQGSGKEAQVLGAQIREGEAIYLWVQFDPASEPVSYRLPWNQQTAKELQQARSETRETGAGVRFRWANRDRSDPDKKVFYPEAQQPLPPKYGAPAR